jgi:ketosteroid isomerase-like protein
MIDAGKSVLSTDLDSVTRDVVERFIRAFQQRDASALPDLVAEDCVTEAMQPAPDGERVEATMPTFISGRR